MSLAEPVDVHDLLNYRLDRLLARSGSMITRLCEGRYGITRREWRLICLLAVHGSMSPSDLSECSHLVRARVSRHVTELVAKGLVARIGVPTDKRRARLALSSRGRELYDALFPKSLELNRLVLQALSPLELAAFEEALARLTATAEQLSSSRPVAEKADRRHGGSQRFREAEPVTRLW